MSAGDHIIRLDNISGGAHIDMAVVARNLASGGYYSPGDLTTYGFVGNSGLGGADETITLSAQPTGYYARVKPIHSWKSTRLHRVTTRPSSSACGAL